MVWWVTLLIFIGLSVIGELLRPKPKIDAPDPSSLGDFQFPTAEEGRAIPVLWGTCKVKGPNVVWYGDLEVVAHTKWIRTGWFSGQDVVVAYKYYLGVQYGLCGGPIDELLEVRFDDKAPDQSIDDSANPIDVFVWAEDLYGGIEDEGGVSGHMDVYKGEHNQDPNDYLEEKLEEDLPGYPRLCYAVARHMYLGTSNYIKAPSWTIRRTPNPLTLTGGKENIDGDANPACMIHELLTNTVWGLGISSAMIDLTNFQEVAETLYTEGFGLSMMVDVHTPARGVIDSICRHIDGVVYPDPETGLFTMKLARFDYDPDTIPVLDQSNVSSVEFNRPGWEETRNVVKIRYIDRGENFQKKIAQAQDLASIEARAGEVAIEEIDFLGLSNSTNAQTIAARALMALSYPFANLSVKCDRIGWSFRPGSVFKLNWAPLGISGLICRVNRLDAGTLESGEISLECVEDIFAVAWTAYTPPPETGWIDPLDVPIVWSDNQDGIFAPYEAVRSDFEPSRDPSVLCLYARDPDGVTIGFTIYYQVAAAGDPWSGINERKIYATTPLGVLTQDVNPWDDELLISEVIDMGRLAAATQEEFRHGKNLLFIASGENDDPPPIQFGTDWELVAWKDIEDLGGGNWRIYNLARGCADTIPGGGAAGRTDAVFKAGCRVWFVTEGYGWVQGIRLPSGHTSAVSNLQYKLGPWNMRQQILWSEILNWEGPLSFPKEQIGVGSYCDIREEKPYVPIHLTLNGIDFPENIADELVLAWDHRDRNGAWDYLDSGVVGAQPADEVYYWLEIYDEDDDLIYENRLLEADGYTLDLGDEISWSGTGYPNETMRIVLKVGQHDYLSGTPPKTYFKLNGFQWWEWTFDCAGWSMLWGDYWGGDPGRSS